MRKTTKILLSLLSVLLLCTLATGCGGDQPEPGEPTPVRIAYFPNITHSQALIGSSQGIFTEALGPDCAVEYYSFNAGPAEIEAMFAGEIDLGYIGPVPAITGYTRSNGDVLILSGCANGGAVLAAAQGSDIASVKDLAEKKVAIPQLGNTQHLSLLNLLSENGLETTSAGGDVDVYAVANSEIKTLMANGEIDAALVPEPWGARLSREVNAEIILDYDEIWLEGNYSTAVVIVHKDFLTAHPDLVEKFLAAHAEITDYINEEPQEAMRIVNEQINELTGAALSDEVLEEAFSRLIFTCDPARESVEAFIDISLAEGFIDEIEDRESLFALDTIKAITAE